MLELQFVPLRRSYMHQSLRLVEDQQIYLNTLRELQSNDAQALQFCTAYIREKQQSDMQRRDMLNKGMQNLERTVTQEEREFDCSLQAIKSTMDDYVQSIRSALDKEYNEKQQEFERSIDLYKNDIENIEKEVQYIVDERKHRIEENNKNFEARISEIEAYLDDFEQKYEEEYEELTELQKTKEEETRSKIDEMKNTRVESMNQKDEELRSQIQKARDDMSKEWEKVYEIIVTLKVKCMGEQEERYTYEKQFNQMLSAMQRGMSKVPPSRSIM